MRTIPLEEKLKRWTLDPKTGCWLWNGAKDHKGYGRIEIPITRQWRFAHRVAYEFWVGPIPSGMTIDHVWDRGCRNRSCIKAMADDYGPAHLEVVTNKVNSLRGTGVGAMYAQRDHCKYGHPYIPENTRYLKCKSGFARVCIACKRAKGAGRDPASEPVGVSRRWWVDKRQRDASGRFI